MAISKRTELAQARRQLKRLEHDEPAFRTRIGEYAPEAREQAITWFEGILEKQREYVKQLEAEVER